MILVDMHTHTNYSDGLFSPEELIDQAIRRELDGIAITDHDTIDSLEKAMDYANEKKEFILIPGIEFGCIYNNKEVHILGYFINHNDNNLIQITRKLKRSRIERGEKMVEKLRRLGIGIDIQDVQKFAKDDYIGRPHIARALIEKKVAKSIDDAFDKYLKRGAPAYVERFQLSVSECIDLIKDMNGISVLAHPALIGDEEIIHYTISLNIDGIECYHSKHTEEETERLINIAKDNKLIVTGGSDYHGDTDILGDYYTDLNSNSVLKRRALNG